MIAGSLVVFGTCILIIRYGGVSVDVMSDLSAVVAVCVIAFFGGIVYLPIGFVHYFRNRKAKAPSLSLPVEPAIDDETVWPPPPRQR